MNSSLGPPVKCGYCGWLIQGCANILQHKCLEHYNEDAHLLRVDDNFVVTVIPRSDAIGYPASGQVHEDDNPLSDELLIKAVSERPALYDMHLPVKHRTKLKINALWLEISNILGGTTPEDAKKRWQYLRDCYVKEKKKQLKYIPSGSAAGTSKKPSFRHYDQMRFLGDSLPSTQTVSSIAMPQSPDDSGCSSFSPNRDVDHSPVLPGPSSGSSTFSTLATSILPDRDALMSPTPPPRTPTPGARKRKLSDGNSDLRLALVTALQQPVPQPDAVDGILARLGEGLRRLPYRERAALEIKFLTMLMEAEDKLNLQD